MLTLLFTILFFMVFGKLLWLAIKAAWGITKILFTIVLLPLILLGLAAAGFMSIAFIGLIVVGLFSLVKAAL
ncbi:MAG: hypothetical protein Q4P20_06795 [Eubacteriales bacterium]|nr:hypothetical protein [Eubacteriales bacterium]